jgi:hypothetical protein
VTAAKLKDTPVERLQQMELASRSVADRIGVLTKQYDLLYQEVIEGEKAGTLEIEQLKKRQAQMALLAEALEILRRAQADATAGMNSSFRDLSSFSVEELTSGLKNVDAAFEESRRRRAMSEEQLTQVVYEETKARAALTEAEVLSHKTLLNTLIKLEEEARARGEDTSHFKVAIAKISSLTSGAIQELDELEEQLKEMQAERDKAANAAQDALQKEANAITELRGKYDPYIEMQNKLAFSLDEINKLHAAGGIELPQYSAALLHVADSIFEVDSKTGKLTDSSRELVDEQIKAYKVAAEGIEISRAVTENLRAEAIARLIVAAAAGEEAAAVAEANKVKTLNEISAGQGDAAERVKAIIKALEGLRGATLKSVTESKGAARANKELAKSYKELSPTVENYNKLLKASAGSGEDAVAAQERLYEMQEYLIAQGEDLNFILPKSVEELNKLANSYDEARSGLQTYNLEMAKVSALFKAGDISAAAYAKRVDEVTLAYARSQGPIQEYFEQLRQEAKFTGGDVVDIIDTFRNNFIDSLVEGEVKFDDFVDNIKRKLIEMAVNTIVINFAGNILGIGGGTGGQVASSLLGGSGGGSALQSAGGVANAFGFDPTFGLGRMATSAITTGLGYAGTFGASLLGGAGASQAAMLASQTATFGMAGATATGTALGASSFAAAAAAAAPLLIPLAVGAAISFLSKDKTDPRAQWGASATNYAGGHGWEDGVFSESKLLGVQFGLGGASHGVKAEEYKALFDGFAAMADSIASLIGEGPAAQVTERIGTTKQGKATGLTSGYTWDTAEGFKHLFGQIIDFAAETGDLMGVLLNERVGELTGTAEEMMEKVANAIAELQVLPEVAKRFEYLGLKLGDTEEASYRVALSMGDIADGLDNLIASQDFYYNNFFTDTEKAQRSIEVAGKILTEFSDTLGLTGAEVIDTRKEFKDYIESLDLTTEAGQEAYWAAMKVADAVIEFEDSVIALEETLKETNQELTDTIDLILDLGFVYHRQSQEVADLAGALNGYFSTQEEMNGALGYFYENFYSEEERRRDQLDAARHDIMAFNFEMGLFGDSMIDRTWQLREFIFAQDASTEAGQRNIAAALKAAGSFKTLADHMIGLAGGIKSVADSVNGMIGSARRDVERFGLTNKQLYEKNKAQIEEIEASMQLLTNPEEIEKAASEIISLHQESWGLLDDSQKKNMQKNFLDYFDELDGYVTDQLSRIAGLNELDVGGSSLADLSVNLQTIVSSYEGVISDLTTAVQGLVTASGSAEGSSTAMQVAAGALQRAADAMPTSIDVNVTVESSEVG